MRRLNVGCGNTRLEGWVNIDRRATPAADLVRPLERGLPYEDGSVDEILADNVLEHIGPAEDFVFILNEFHRVLRPGGRLTVIVPDARSQGAWQDPTHQRAFVPRSALYWNRDLPWADLYGITADFDVAVYCYGEMEGEAFLRFECTARPKVRQVEPATAELARHIVEHVAEQLEAGTIKPCVAAAWLKACATGEVSR